MPEATLPLIFTTSFVVALSGAMMPGPLLALVIGESARRGFWAGPRIVLGHGILEMAVVAALAAGLSELVRVNAVCGVVGLAGGGILLAMGFATVKKGRERTGIPASLPARSTGNRLAVVSGILGSIANPYWFIWWITLGTIYLVWSLNRGIAGVAAFFTGHILADLAWYAVVALAIATGRRAMSDAVYRGLLVACGLALVALGAYFVVSGLRFLAA